MRDLELWRRLDSGVASLADLAEIAALPLSRRCAYVGSALRLVTHAEAAMRVAALRVVAGSRGIEGVRAIVAALGDDDETVRAAAVDALRDTSRDAPLRYTHALFHPRADVRRAALAHDLPQPAAELATYLRADAHTADLAATKARWPAESLRLAFSLYAEGHITAEELVSVCGRSGSSALADYFTKAHRRPVEAINAFFDGALARGAAIGAPAGSDVIDLYVRALAACPVARRDDSLQLVVIDAKRPLMRRIVIALLAELLRTGGDGPLWGLCIAFEPRLLAIPGLPLEHVDAIVDALVHVRGAALTEDQLERLLRIPAAHDLALAVALIRRAPAQRLKLLAKLRGEDSIIEALVTSDRGWREICLLPPEAPSLDMGWLAQIEKRDYKRYVALAGIAIRTYHTTRQSLFIEQLARRHRPAVFLAALLGLASASDERILALQRNLAPRVDRTGLVSMLPELLASDTTGRLAVGLCRYVSDSVLAAAARDIAAPHLVALVALLDSDPIPRDRELALAKALSERGIPEVADWCTRVNSILSATPVSSTSVGPPLVRKRRELTIAEERNIVGAGTGRALDTALAPAIGGCVTGLVRALDRPKPEPHVMACVALLACADPLDDVARLLDLWSEPSAAFETAVDNTINSMAHVDDLPMLARARLWRWERQQFAFLDWVEHAGGALAVLEMADKLRRRFVRNTIWQAVSEGMMLLRYRAVTRFAAHATPELAQYAAERVDEPIGRHAARLVVAVVEAGIIPVSAVRDRVLDRIADADGETRSYVARLIRLEGMPEVQISAPPPPVNVVDDIRTSTDLESLATWCHDPRPAIVQEAALALVALGPAGQLRLAAVLAAGGLTSPVPLLATIVLWDHAPAVDAVREIALRAGLEPSWQFHLSLALLYRGEQDALSRALDAIRSTSERWHFRRADWEALVNAADIVTCAIALADAPHHHAYQRAVNVLLSLTRPTSEVHDALVRFLEIDSDRPLHLRMAAARYVAKHWRDLRGLPLLVEEVCDPANASAHELIDLVDEAGLEKLARLVVDAGLVGGEPVCSEPRMWRFVSNIIHRFALPRAVASELNLRIFESAMHAPTRRYAASIAVPTGESNPGMQRIAQVFAWGVRRGAELAGRLFSFHITSKEADLGHTRLDTTRIFVSPLPMLRDETNGQDIVEGLVLHEIGHHVYHRGEKALALWKKAHAEGIGHFLNLIADEHLERNLRAVDPSYGDRLKRLGSYAFHHAPQEMKIASLCEALGASTAHALTHAELGVGFAEDAVRLRRGAILGELDRIGHPVARFSRALRMGLGNRAGDPLNAAALALCGKELRALDMQGLYDLTVKLTEMFGGRVEITKVFGGPEGLVFGERDDDCFGAGIDDDILQREIERILEPSGASRGKAGRGGRLAINVNPDTTFNPITKIVRVQGPDDANKHHALAREVARHSTRLRGYLDELGLRWLPARARTQGRALDKTRLRALVTRNDPRILVARTPLRKTDLFVGTIVDCSGSMQARDNISRARRFAVLVAEAVRNLQGVEARFFGFTDSIIYDAGDKMDCHVTALEAGGGNNDAAALYHAANVALASPQRAKVLIMISDGLPTECSVAALRNLVTELTRKRGIVCAQVGVIPLQEICFPHYVLINDDQLDVAVAKFGRMIADLARRSLAS